MSNVRIGMNSGLLLTGYSGNKGIGFNALSDLNVHASSKYTANFFYWKRLEAKVAKKD